MYVLSVAVEAAAATVSADCSYMSLLHESFDAFVCLLPVMINTFPPLDLCTRTYNSFLPSSAENIIYPLTQIEFMKPSCKQCKMFHSNMFYFYNIYMLKHTNKYEGYQNHPYSNLTISATEIKAV